MTRTKPRVCTLPRVAGGLWIGPRLAARSPAQLLRARITHIVAANGDECALAEARGISCLSLPLDDDLVQPLEPWLSRATLFVLSALGRLGPPGPPAHAAVLVHCTAGVSHSASVCMAAALAAAAIDHREAEVAAGGAATRVGVVPANASPAAVEEWWSRALDRAGVAADSGESCPVHRCVAGMRRCRPWVRPNGSFHAQLRAWAHALARSPPGVGATLRRWAAGQRARCAPPDGPPPGVVMLSRPAAPGPGQRAAVGGAEGDSRAVRASRL